jgi:hypothetical protein
MLCWGRKRKGGIYGGFVLLELGMGYFSGEKHNLKPNKPPFKYRKVSSGDQR